MMRLSSGRHLVVVALLQGGIGTLVRHLAVLAVGDSVLARHGGSQARCGY